MGGRKVRGAAPLGVGRHFESTRLAEQCAAAAYALVVPGSPARRPAPGPRDRAEPEGGRAPAARLAEGGPSR
jgi:hypothetical protein